MTELDLVWSQMLQSAVEHAEISGRTDLAEYLRLKATNDAIRTAGVKWLFDNVIEIAYESRTAALKVERVEPHTFKRGVSRMAGSLVSIGLGVRCLELQAGWTRTPSDGIMHGAALAAADILHFGRVRQNAELRLVHFADLPQWLDARDNVVDTAYLRRHIEILFSAEG